MPVWKQSLTGMVLYLLTGTVLATEVRICSGKKGGTYEKAAHWFFQNLQDRGIDAVIVPSNGSMDSHVQLAGGRCDLGFMQGDSFTYFNKNFDRLMKEYGDRTEHPLDMELANSYYPEALSADGGLYMEQIHMLCNRALGIDTFEEFVERVENIESGDLGVTTLEKPQILLGPTGGGATASFQNFVKAIPILEKVYVENTDQSGDIKNGVSAALIKVFQTSNACALHVSKIANAIVATLDGLAQKLPEDPAMFYFEGVEIIEINYRALNRLEDSNGRRIYEAVTIGEPHYQRLRGSDDSINQRIRRSDGSINADREFYTPESRETDTLAIPTHAYIHPEFQNTLSRNTNLNQALTDLVQEATALKGNFPEVKQ